MGDLLRIPTLTRRRIWLAFIIAVGADTLQWILVPLGPAGWLFLDQVIDVIAMSLLTFVIGFHPLFLPTFLVEFFPGLDMLPTWTGCVGVVVALRRKQPPANPAPPPASPPTDIIDV